MFSKLKPIGLAVGIGYAMNELGIAISYYSFLKTQPNYEIANEGTDKQVLVMIGEGKHMAAPIWESNVAIISADSEFSALHECGHVQFPHRTLRALSVVPVLHPKIRIRYGFPITMSLLWLCSAVNERFADRWALQRCTKNGLQEELNIYNAKAGQQNMIFFPPDPHASAANRAESIRRRLRQLEDYPDFAEKPHDLPLRLPIFALNVAHIASFVYDPNTYYGK